MRPTTACSTLLALLVLPLAARAQGPGGDKPPPRLVEELDLKALSDVRSPDAPAQRALRAGLAALGGGRIELPPPARALDAQRTAPSSPRPVSGAWTRTVEELAWDRPGDGDLWVRGRTFKAGVGPAGLTYVPFLGSSAARSWPLRVELVAASVDGQPLELAAEPTVTRDGDVVSVDHGALVEVLRFELEAVEQVFVLPRLERRGELALELALESELVAATQGDALELSGPEGAVRYGEVTVLDAAGGRVRLPSRLESGRIVLRVPEAFVAQATLPLVVDPLITTLAVATGPVNCGRPDVAYDAGQDVYLVAWEERYSGTDYDINSVLVSSSGTLLASQYIDFSSARWKDFSLADNYLAGTFLVAALVDDTDIRGRIRPADGSSVGPQLVLASAADGYAKGSPAVGGDASAVGPTYFLLVYRRTFSAADWDIHGRLFDGQGAPVGSTILIDNSPGTQDMQPVVSPTNGHLPFQTQRWNVMWARGPQHGSSVDDLWAAQLTWDGVVHTSSFNLTGTPTVFENLWAEQLACTPPLDDPSGNEREWAVSYTLDQWPSGYPGVVRLLRGDIVHDTLDVGAASGNPGMAFYQNALDSDGTVLVLGANSLAAAQAFTLTTTGHKLALSEGPVAVDPTSELTRHASLALAAGPLKSGPRSLLVLQEGPNSTDGDVFAAVYEARDHALGGLACSSNPNSSGFMAFLSAVGSPKVADNRVTLECETLPLFQNGILIASRNAASVPFGQGVLCLAPPIHRFSQQVQNSGAQGWIALPVNLAAIPGGAVVLPGETWHFQYWTRDGSAVNLSNSVAITFQ